MTGRRGQKTGLLAQMNDPLQQVAGTFERSSPGMARSLRPWTGGDGDARAQLAFRSGIVPAPFYRLLACAFLVGLLHKLIWNLEKAGEEQEMAEQLAVGALDAVLISLSISLQNKEVWF